MPIARTDLAAATCTAYVSRVCRYLAWLAGTGCGTAALCDPIVRVAAVADWRAWMRANAIKATTMNNVLVGG